MPNQLSKTGDLPPRHNVGSGPSLGDPLISLAVGESAFVSSPRALQAYLLHHNVHAVTEQAAHCAAVVPPSPSLGHDAIRYLASPSMSSIHCCNGFGNTSPRSTSRACISLSASHQSSTRGSVPPPNLMHECVKHCSPKRRIGAIKHPHDKCRMVSPLARVAALPLESAADPWLRRSRAGPFAPVA